MTARNEIIATIASSGTLSGMVDGGGYRLAGVYLPSNFQGTGFKILGTPKNQSMGADYILSNNSGNISYTCAAGQYIGFDMNANTAGLAQIKILAASSQSSGAVNIVTVWVPWSN